MNQKGLRFLILSLAMAALLIISLIVISFPGREKPVASYATSLNGRTSAQAWNARLAARRIDGVVIQPGEVFSFNKTVGSWSADRGYEKAPVSYDGELIKSWGGGVCQTSSTLYVAALYAGLDIVERHRHHWPAKYAPPGLDAAVAQSDVDLKFRNTLPWPIRISAIIRKEKLICSILCSHFVDYKVKIKRDVLSVIPAGEVVQVSPESEAYRLVNPGQPGLHVAVHRTITGKTTRRQMISNDEYPTMSRIIRVKYSR